MSFKSLGAITSVVVADGHQLKDAFNSAAMLRHVGIQYPVVLVRLANQAFHPKAVLLAGEEKLKVFWERQPDATRLHP